MVADRRSSQLFGRALAAAALLAAAFALAGCSTSIADMPVGTTADAPAPHEPGAYLPVHDLPPDRDEAIISPAERAKIQADLTKARDHQVTATAAPTTATAATPKDVTSLRQSRRAKPPGQTQAEE
jgi:hypothetical protein